MSKYGFKLSRFDKGLNNKVSPIFGNPDEASDLRNVHFDDIGAVGTRDAKEAWTTLSGNHQGMMTFKPSLGQEQLLILADNSSLWSLTGPLTDTTKTAYNATHFSGSTSVWMQQYQDRAWMADGTVAMKFIDSTGLKYWGSYPQTVTASVNDAGAGDMSGTYNYVIANENQDGQLSDYGPATADIVVSSGAVTVSGIEVMGGLYGISSKYLCRNTAAASGVYYVVTALTAAQTTVTDTHADSLLLTDAPVNIGLPSAWTIFLTHRERVFAVDSESYPHRLYFSNIGLPEKWPTDNYLEVSLGDGYEIRALGIHSSGILIAKDDGQGNGSVYLLYMPTDVSADWQLIKIDTPYGASAPQIVKILDKSLLVSKHGIHNISESGDGILKPDPLSYNISESIYNCNANAFDIVRAASFKDKIYFGMPYGNDTTNSRIFAFDYVRGRSTIDLAEGSWTLYKDSTNSTDANITNVRDMAIYKGELITATHHDSSSLISLWKDTTQAYDTLVDGSSSETIDAMFQTMIISGLPEHEANLKVWRWLYITLSQTGTEGQYMMIEYSGDLTLETPKSVLVSLDGGGATWGISKWGFTHWGPGWDIQRIKVVLKPTVSRTIQLRFKTYSQLTKWKVHGCELFYNLRGM